VISRFSDPAESALKTKRDKNGSAENPARFGPSLIETDVLVVKFEFPGAVQASPVGSLELRLRVFPPWGKLALKEARFCLCTYG
jgi:hypothetical protein